MTLEIHTDTATAVSTALRDLAHENPSVDAPERVYPTLGELLSSARTFSHVLDQLVHTLRARGERARDDDGDTSVGASEVTAAAAALTAAAGFLFQAECAIDVAAQHASRIAWPPRESETRWISVVFLQGESADTMLDLIDRDGPLAAIEHLRQWDFGDETTDAALVNGYVYDTVPSGVSDRVARDDGSGYTLTYSANHGYVSLLLRHHDRFEGEATASDSEPSHPVDRARANDHRRWVDSGPGPSHPHGKTLSR